MAKKNPCRDVNVYSDNQESSRFSETQIFAIIPQRFQLQLSNPHRNSYFCYTHIDIIVPKRFCENLRISTSLESFSWNQWERNPTCSTNLHSYSHCNYKQAARHFVASAHFHFACISDLSGL